MSVQSTLLVGTRDSVLARLQTDLALKAISSRFPELQFEIIAVKTSGDKILNKPLSQLGGRGVFVKELEEALLDHRVDLVVHSLKDLPTDMPENLVLAATIERSDPRDVLVSKTGVTFIELPAGCRVATSSQRRAAQLTALRTDLKFVDIRGNIQTRLRKLDEGECDAMILAAAGLKRLGLEERVSQYFDAEECIPAVGQGALGIECHANNHEVLNILKAINDAEVWACTSAERAFLNKLGGGCSVPVGGLARMVSESELSLNACVASLDGQRIYRGTAAGAVRDSESIGRDLANSLISQGAAEVVQALLNTSIGTVSPP